MRKEPITKDELRRRLAAAREALSPAEVADLSGRIRERLLKTPEVLAAASLFTYVSHGNEVDTRELIRALLREGKTVTVPLIVGASAMEAHRLRSLDDLSPGRFGILAPREPDPWKGAVEVCIAPGVAFTLRGDRLGRGKAFYDRFLSEHPRAFAIGLCYEFQVVEEMPADPTDRRVDLVITEKRAIRMEKRR